MSAAFEPENSPNANLARSKIRSTAHQQTLPTGGDARNFGSFHQVRWSDAAYLRGRGSLFSKLMLYLRIREVKSIIAGLHGGFPRRLLDIGAADGLASEIIASGNDHWEFYGVERSQELIRFSTPRQVTLLQGDARSLPLADHTIGVALFMSSFKHIFRSHEALAETRRILSDQGHVIFVEPSPWFIKLGARLGKFDLSHIPNNWTLRQYENQLRAAGFSVSARRRFACGLYQVVVAQKILHRTEP